MAIEAFSSLGEPVIFEGFASLWAEPIGQSHYNKIWLFSGLATK